MVKLKQLTELWKVLVWCICQDKSNQLEFVLAQTEFAYDNEIYSSTKA